MSVSKSVRFSEDLVAAIERAAEEQDRSFSYLVARACAERFLFEANPYSVADRPKRVAEVGALEKALGGVAASGFDSEGDLVAGSVPARPASPRAPEPPAVLDAVAPDSSSGRGKASRPMVPVPGVVRASSLVKRGVRPIPKRGEK